MKNILRDVSILSVIAFSAACSGGENAKPVDLGDRQPVAAIGEKLSDYAGNWDGYGEAVTFDASGSDRIRISLATDGSGTVRFGEAASLPVPAVADLPTAYFPNLDNVGSFGIETISGVDFSVHDTMLTGKHLRFNIAGYEAWTEYCSIIPPLSDPQSPTGYSCSTSAQLGASGCGAGVCICDENECQAQEALGSHVGDALFDGTLEGIGDEFVATLGLRGGELNRQRVTVRLTRASE
jgi:hypothetical protein